MALPTHKFDISNMKCIRGICPTVYILFVPSVIRMGNIVFFIVPVFVPVWMTGGPKRIYGPFVP
jgi:hypothetical protein